eukprot:8178627-Pyramimonas_sp.AAC.1
MAKTCKFCSACRGGCGGGHGGTPCPASGQRVALLCGAGSLERLGALTSGDEDVANVPRRSV